MLEITVWEVIKAEILKCLFVPESRGRLFKTQILGSITHSVGLGEAQEYSCLQVSDNGDAVGIIL